MTARLVRIPDDVAELLHRGEGVADTGLAAAAGLDESRLRRLAGRGFLTRLAPGSYASTHDLRHADRWESFRLRSLALGRAAGPGAYLTGWSAIAVSRMPTLGAPPKLPVAVWPKAKGLSPRLTPYGRLLVEDIPDGHLIRRAVASVVSPAWSAVHVARTDPVPHGLVIADHVARTGMLAQRQSGGPPTGPGFDLAHAVGHVRSWKGAARARWVVAHADPAAETPVETLGRFTCVEFDLPRPVSNAWVVAGGRQFRVDGLWPWHWAIHEADGAVKYNNRPDAAQVVAEQNEREWLLRRAGLDLARYGWDLALHRRSELARRFAALLHDNPPRSTPVRWWKEVPGVGKVEPAAADWPSPHPVPVTLPANWLG